MAAFTFDEQLVRRMMAGDRDALAELYDANAAAAYTLALSMCAAPSDAEEAVRRAFVNLWEARSAIRLEGGEFALHFYAVLRSHCRALRAERAPFAAPNRMEGPMYEKLLISLPPIEREAVALVVLRGYDEHEASKAIGATPADVRTLVRRGLERLSERMGEEAGASDV